MRIFRYMLMGRFWTEAELVPLYASLIPIVGVCWGILWLCARFHAPQIITTVAITFTGSSWLLVGAKLIAKRVKDIREEEATGRYLP